MKTPTDPKPRYIISGEESDNLDEFIIRSKRDATEGDHIKEADRLRCMLRAAPQAVSLEGIDVRSLSFWWDCVEGNEKMARVSDLQRLFIAQPDGTVVKWLTRAVETLARNQDDERIVFLLDFDREFPDGLE